MFISIGAYFCVEIANYLGVALCLVSFLPLRLAFDRILQFLFQLMMKLGHIATLKE